MPRTERVYQDRGVSAIAQWQRVKQVGRLAKVHTGEQREIVGGLQQPEMVENRVFAGLLQSEASALLGKSRTFVSKCELGERRVDLIEAQQFAKIYKKKFTYFQIL